MLVSDSSFSAFIPPSSHSSSEELLPPLCDDEEFWEIFLKLFLEHKAKLNENLGNTLNTSLLFAALFSAVNVGILALSLPTLTSALPTTTSIHANRIFASCLTCSFIAAFFSFIGKQWLTHYNTLGPTAHLENRKTLQCRLDGAIRWHFEGFVDLGLTSLLQITLIFFMAEWVAYLHGQGTHVSYPVNGISNFGIFLAVLMLGCASWDPWCPYQTPYTTTIPQALRNSIPHFSKIRLGFLQAVAAIRQLSLSGLRSHLLLGTFWRPDNTDEVMDLRSLCWMLENAPRGPPLLRVAQHITSICFCSSQGTRRERIMASPHLFRIHETFWYLVMKIKRISRNNPENANDHIEILQHVSIFGCAVICTSPQWMDGLRPFPMSTMIDIFKFSFDKHGPRNATCWKEISPFLYLQVSYQNEGRDATYHYIVT